MDPENHRSYFASQALCILGAHPSPRDIHTYLHCPDHSQLRDTCTPRSPSESCKPPSLIISGVYVPPSWLAYDFRLCLAQLQRAGCVVYLVPEGQVGKHRQVFGPFDGHE